MDCLKREKKTLPRLWCGWARESLSIAVLLRSRWSKQLPFHSIALLCFHTTCYLVVKLVIDHWCPSWGRWVVRDSKIVIDLCNYCIFSSHPPTVRTCSVPPLANGGSKTTEVTYLEQVNFTCNTGYTLVHHTYPPVCDADGNILSNQTCERKLQWAHVPVCQLIPKDAHGF